MSSWWPFDEVTTEHIGLALALLITAWAHAVQGHRDRRRRLRPPTNTEDGPSANT